MKYTNSKRILSLGMVMLASIEITISVALANPIFCAVGWEGEFTTIDPSVGPVSPTRTDLPDELQALSWSPDGTLYAGRLGDLYKLDPLSGDIEYLLSVNVDIRAMAFSPSGQLYVSGGDTGSPDPLGIIDLNAGTYTEISVLSGDVDQCQGLAFSPGGELYGVVPHDPMNSDIYDFFKIDLDNAETQLIGSHSGHLHQSISFTSDGRLYGLGQFGPLGAHTSEFAELNPGDGSVIGQVITFEGDYRGLEVVPEPGTLCILALGGLLLLRKRRT